MNSVLKLLAGVTIAMMFALTPSAYISGGDAWAQSKPKKGCECMKLCRQTGMDTNKCVQCRDKCR